MRSWGVTILAVVISTIVMPGLSTLYAQGVDGDSLMDDMTMKIIVLQQEIPFAEFKWDVRKAVCVADFTALPEGQGGNLGLIFVSGLVSVTIESQRLQLDGVRHHA